jgi:hypothetical protein
MARLPFTPAPAAAPTIQHILSGDLIELINTTPEQIIPLRGLIRQQVNLAVPKDLFIAGNGQAILGWIIAHFKGTPRHHPSATATTAVRAGTIAVSVEFYADVTGRVDFRRRDYHNGTIHIPLGQFAGCADEDEVEDVIRSFVNRRGVDLLEITDRGHLIFGDTDDEETDEEIDNEDTVILSDTTELLAQINATNPPPA